MPLSLLTHRDILPIPGHASNDAQPLDRRGRPRLNVQWTVFLLRSSDAQPVESQTSDLSSQGFYCRIPKPCIPGETLEFAIVIPKELTSGVALSMRGRAVVIRIDRLSPNKFAMGCRFESYAIRPHLPLARIHASDHD